MRNTVDCMFDLDDQIAHKYADERAADSLGDYQNLTVIKVLSASEVRVHIVGGRWDGAIETVSVDQFYRVGPVRAAA